MKIFIRSILTFIFLASGLPAAQAEERIKSFDAVVEVQLDGDFIVTETITVNSEGQQIRRGIFRDLPRYQNYHGHDIPVRYKILSVTRNGDREPYEVEKEGNAYRIRIGNADKYLARETHSYIIRFEIKDEIRRDTEFDEVYWNVTGNYWRFPIDTASIQVRVPDGIEYLSSQAFTGRYGSTEQNAILGKSRNTFSYRTDQALASGEGMTVSFKFAKGVMLGEPNSTRRYIWWLKHGALILLSLSFLGISGFYILNWMKVGKDPAKGAVFPVYEPPESYSAAASSHIYYRGLKGHQALTATLIGLSNKKWLAIETDKRKTILTPLDRTADEREEENEFELTFEAFTGLLKGDKETLKKLGLDDEVDDEPIITEAPENSNRQNLNTEEAYLFQRLFPAKRTKAITLKKKVNTHFNLSYSAFQRKIAKDFGKPYYRFNAGYTMAGFVMSFAAIALTMSQVSKLTPSMIWVLLGVLAVMNLVFLFLMPAPTRKGQKVRTELEGLRLYMKTAEKQKMDSVEVGSEQLPPMGVKRYESLLPYAIALGVEKPWSKYFEKVMPEEAKKYANSVSAGDFSDLSSMTSNMVSNIGSGVTSAAPQSSGSSSSGGGGFSGGGGGGGGGGGW